MKDEPVQDLGCEIFNMLQLICEYATKHNKYLNEEVSPANILRTFDLVMID